MSQPYYQDDWVTIYQGDCRDVMPSLTYGAIVSDPPYGIGHVASGYWGHERITGDDAPFDPSLIRLDVPVILWGANHYADRLPSSSGWLVWNKRDRVSRNLPGSDAELAWTNVIQQVRIFTHVWIPHTLRREVTDHPTQKPLPLLSWCLELIPPIADPILDPYMGSGTTLKAAKDLGRAAIGIEVEERYCEIAAMRCSQDVLALESAR